jgi:hypothetical protein
MHKVSYNSNSAAEQYGTTYDAAFCVLGLAVSPAVNRSRSLSATTAASAR